MKKILLFTAFLGCFAWGYAQTKNVAVETAGTLSTLLTADETATLTDLTVTGSINKADLNTLNGMPALATLDLSGANIVASSDGETSYAENTIPEATFMGNKALISVLFPASLQHIGTEAFADCINIKAIDLSACPELVTVGYRAFGGIDGLESLSFNGCSKLTTIDEYAFSNDFYIATIDFTGCTSLSTIGANAFNNVREALTTLDLSDCTSLTVIGKSSFKSLKKMTSLTLPENVEIIGMGAFYSCHSLETITLPASVDSIAPHSFGQPKAMKTVVCLGTDTRAAEMAFSNNTYISSPSTKPAEENYTDKGYTLVVPKGCADTYRAGIEWAKFPVINEAAEEPADGKVVNVETAGTLNTLLTADEAATLTALTVTGSINKADLDTLNGMPALATLDLSGANIVASSDGETSYAENTIPEATFMGNKALISVLFPASLQHIGTEAFADCINIKAIDLSACPELVTVGYRAFGGIDGLESLSFNGCSKLTTIDEYAFSNDFYIATIDFTGCTSLSTIGANAFNNVREALTTLDLSDCTSLTVIGKSSFKSLKKMTSLTLPENVEIIGMGAFYSCHSLETITLPASVDSIAPHSFGQPKAMKTVVCLGTDTRAAEMAFSNNTYISSPSTKPAEENYTDKGYTLVVPKGCADTYRAGVEWAKFPVINESTSAIESVESNSTTAVYATADAIVVEGAAAGTPVTVYALSGAQVKNAVADGSALMLTLDQKGIFLVKVGNEVCKVVL